MHFVLQLAYIGYKKMYVASKLEVYKVRLSSLSLLCSLVQRQTAKFPHSPILDYACWSLLTENNGKNNTTAVGLCAVFVVSWWRNKGLHTLNRMHNEVWDYAEI